MLELIRIRQIFLALLLLCSSALVLFMEGTSSSSDKDLETKRGITSRLLQKRSSLVELEEASIGLGRYVKEAVGAGSSPPRCISKCASCTPCKPVRVPVKPGTPRLRPSEYYPEAWRCMCHNKLYMP